ncbi:MAG: c-type cytochrome [Pseudomonadota bacterium]
MMRAAFLAAVFLAGTAAQAGDVGTLTARCAFCHGAQGVSGNPIWPSLAGLDADYLAQRMQSYRAGENASANALQMRFVLNALTEAEVSAIAQHYAALDPAQPIGPEEAQGAQIYHSGLEERAAPCVSCHGANAQGDSDLLAPRLAGQSAHYMTKQLAAYAAETRPDKDSGMAQVAQALTPEQRRAVSLYLQSMAPAISEEDDP